MKIDMTKMQEDLGDFIEAAGLLEYDPLLIAKIYQKNPIRLFKRLWATLVPISLFLLGVGFDKIIGLLNSPQRKKERAREFSNLLVKLGPAFIKAGQALSTRPDIVPQIILEELAQLQDQLPGFNGELAMACLQEDLEMKVEDIFEEIEKEPISAASLGQVHQATLKSGEKVAVKIQRPGLREQITLDLYIVRNIAIWLKNNIKLIRSDLVALIDELGKRVFEEMDYINEANNAERFKSLHQENPKIAVPKIYKEYTSRRVLTMEWIEGVKLTNIDAIKRLGIDPDNMIEIGVNCSLKQLLEHGFFHADPHPGNLLALKDGRLCYLDFGMMSEVESRSRTGLIKAVVHLVNKDFDSLSKDFVTLGFIDKKVDLKPIVPAFEKVFSSALEVGVNKMDFKSVTDDLSGVMYKFPFRLPPYYALIIRSLITLEGIALSVDPNFKILGAAYPYFAQRLLEDPNPELRNSLKEMVFEGTKLNWNKLEDLITSAATKAQLNIEDLIDKILDFLYSKNGDVLKEELVNTIINKIDSIGWNAINKINIKLPQYIQINSFIKKEDEVNLKMEPVKQLIKIIKKIPGYKKRIILKKLPRILIEGDTRNMSIKIAKGITKKSMARVLKLSTKQKNK